MTNQELARMLRQLADVYERNPEIPQLYNLSTGLESVYCHKPEPMVAAVKAFSPGMKSKEREGILFTPARFPLLRVFGFSSGICERFEVGRRIVPATEDQVIPGKPEHEEIIYETRCPESLLAGAGE